jgi:hypothetical protein
MLLGLNACGNHGTDSAEELNEHEVGPNTTEDDVESKSAKEMFRAPERPWDLAVSPEGLIYCSTQGGNKLYIWNPVLETRTEFERSISDVQNILFDGDTLYFTTTDNGVTGGFSMLEDNQPVELYTQADDGTLIRWPMDFVKSPNEEWVIADFQQGLFVVEETGRVTTRPSGSNKPQGLLFIENTLFVSGEDGIFKIEWPNGEPKLIDERSGLALIEVNGEVWSSNSEVGLFIVEGNPIGLTQAARPGSLLQTTDGIYFADHVGEGVWLYESE